MGRYYTEGKIEIRPGVYRRISTDDTNVTVPDAINGYGAIPIQADFGPLGQAVEFDCSNAALAKENIEHLYGLGGTVNVAKSFIDGGLTTLVVCRVGNGGTNGTLELKANSEKAVTLTTLYPGKKSLTVSIREALLDGKEMVVYDGTTQLEVIAFEGTEEVKEAKALEAAVNANSAYFSAKAEEVEDEMDIVSQSAITEGELPAVTNQDYPKALKELYPYPYNVIISDVVTADVQKMVMEFNSSRHLDGKEGIVVLGDEVDDFDAMLEKGKAYDSELVVYFPDSFIEADGKAIKGIEAIARAAGVIAGTPTNESIEHKKMPGAVSVAKTYENREYDKAAAAGILLLSSGPNGEAWFDTGYNTLKTLAPNQDEGWKKIKRARVRQEMFDRIDRVLEPMVGRYPNLPDTIDRLRTKALKVLDTMADEQKIARNAEFNLAAKGYDADYAYFDVLPYDIDTLSKIYLNYKFRYANNSTGA